MGYGDEGKGGVTDFLCSPHVPEPALAVVRFNGGAQAGHNVVTEDGRHHTFAQFGSGTFQGARTHLSRFMMADPLTLLAEARHLEEVGVRNPARLLTVDADALLITPFHVAANRARERARGDGRHGSCGMGIGETAAYALHAGPAAPRFGDLLAPDVLYAKLGQLRRHLEPDAGPMDDAARLAGRLFGHHVRDLAEETAVHGSHLLSLLNQGPVVFEGAQGVLLDEVHGFAPHTTWSTTTFANAEALLAGTGHTAVRLGVTRAYATRHGPGPFPTEDPALRVPEPHNALGEWQGAFRQGHLDLVALRYALDVTGGIDALAVTHADTTETMPGLKACCGYALADGITGDLSALLRGGVAMEALSEMLMTARPAYRDLPPGGSVAAIAEVLAAPVAVISRGPTAMAKVTVARVG
jgi:adenylosuccinate synthase